MPVFSPLTALWTPSPGPNRLTRMRPSVSETSDALTNHSIALPPTRPTVLASAMCPMPTTSVEKTSGAKIILISRRKIVLPIET